MSLAALLGGEERARERAAASADSPSGPTPSCLFAAADEEGSCLRRWPATAAGGAPEFVLQTRRAVGTSLLYVFTPAPGAEYGARGKRQSRRLGPERSASATRAARQQPTLAAASWAMIGRRSGSSLLIGPVK